MYKYRIPNLSQRANRSLNAIRLLHRTRNDNKNRYCSWYTASLLGPFWSAAAPYQTNMLYRVLKKFIYYNIETCYRHYVLYNNIIIIIMITIIFILKLCACDYGYRGVVLLILFSVYSAQMIRDIIDHDLKT